MSSRCPHNKVNFGPLAAEIGLPVWGTPVNFNGFRVLAALLQRHRSQEANETLHYVWPSPGLLHCIYIFRESCRLTEFCQVQNSLCVQVLRCHILAVLLHGTHACIDNRKINLLDSNTCSTCSDNMVNFGPLAAEIGLPVWGSPANFNGFRVLASLLQRRRSPEANQTLHDVWPSPGLLHYIYTFGGSCPLTKFCQVQNSLCVQVLRCHILVALLHGTRVVGISQTLRR